MGKKRALMNLEEMKQNYLNYVNFNLRKGSYNFYKIHLNYLIKYFNDNRIFDSDEIDSLSINNYISFARSKDNKNSTINKRILCLKNMFKFNKIKNVDLLEISKFREEKNTFSVLTNNEINKLIDYLNSSLLKNQNKLLIYLLIDTGARISEILNIKISNINYSNNTIYLDVTKTHNSRYVPYTEATKVLLKKYIEENDFKNNKLFDLSISGVESLFRRIKDRLNLNKFHPHMLRHTLATKLHKNGVSIMIVQKIMGHKNISTTERYIHFDLDDVLRAYNSVM